MTLGLPDDWKPFERVQVEKAIAAHPQRDLIEAFSVERNEDGHTWVTSREDDGDPKEKWVAIWLRSVDTFDPRPDILIARWPEQSETDARLDAEAQAGEASDD